MCANDSCRSPLAFLDRAQTLFPQALRAAVAAAGSLSGGGEHRWCDARALRCRPRMIRDGRADHGALSPLLCRPVGWRIRTINREGTAIFLSSTCVPRPRASKFAIMPMCCRPRIVLSGRRALSNDYPLCGTPSSRCRGGLIALAPRSWNWRRAPPCPISRSSNLDAAVNSSACWRRG